MATNIIDERLKRYAPQTKEDEEQALKEIMQEIAIYGLSTSGFFDKALFHGGTSLRILYDLPRFSEDLDFLLKKPDADFKWMQYVDAIVSSFKQFGVNPEVTDKSKVSNTVKKIFLKDDSIGKILDLSFTHHPGRKLTIKFEIDTNPPAGSVEDLKFLEFPLDCSIVSQDLSSSFAGKCHALLCRDYIKGRDWYDFAWYIAKQAKPNLVFLQNALLQQGPWAKQNIVVTPKWLIEKLQDKINHINWNKATSDVEQFLYLQDRQVLALWGIDYFMDKLTKLERLL